MPHAVAEKSLSCRYCEAMRRPAAEREITGATVRTAAGPMHPDCADANVKAVAAKIAAAIAAGTHNPHSQQFCGQCRQWVECIFYVTLGGTRLCPRCADECGQGPRAIAEARNKFNPPAKAPVRVNEPTAPRSAVANARCVNAQPLSDEERRRRFPVAEVQAVDWGDE